MYNENVLKNVLKIISRKSALPRSLLRLSKHDLTLYRLLFEIIVERTSLIAGMIEFIVQPCGLAVSYLFLFCFPNGIFICFQKNK